MTPDPTTIAARIAADYRDQFAPFVSQAKLEEIEQRIAREIAEYAEGLEIGFNGMKADCLLMQRQRDHLQAERGPDHVSRLVAERDGLLGLLVREIHIGGKKKYSVRLNEGFARHYDDRDSAIAAVLQAVKQSECELTTGSLVALESNFEDYSPGKPATMKPSSEGEIARLKSQVEHGSKAFAGLQAENARLRAAVERAIETIEGLADQQAMQDCWYEQPLKEIQNALNTERG